MRRMLYCSTIFSTGRHDTLTLLLIQHTPTESGFTTQRHRQRKKHLNKNRVLRYNRGLSSSDFWSNVMARVCQVTGKAPMVGNNVSHANNKTKRRFLPNLQYRRFWVETENRFVRLRVSNAGLRTIDKKGIEVVLAELRARGEI